MSTKREMIFNTALSMFKSEKYGKVTLDKIAEASDTSVFAIKHNFHDKKELFRLIILLMIEPIEEELSDIYATTMEYSQKLVKAIELINNQLSVIIERNFEDHILSDLASANQIQEEVEKWVDSVYLRFINLGYSTHDIDKKIQRETILSYIQAAVNIQKNKKFKAEGFHFNHQLLHLFLYGLVGIPEIDYQNVDSLQLLEILMEKARREQPSSN